MTGYRKAFDLTINGLYRFAAEHMPEDWSIHCQVVSGECSMWIEHEGYCVEDASVCDGDHIDHWLYYINYARVEAGMEPVEWGDAELDD
jgi:hypothetical protein